MIKSEAAPEVLREREHLSAAAEIPARTPEELRTDIDSARQATWFETYVYNKEKPVLGTLWNILTMKPVEGVVNAVTFNRVPYIGKIARFAALAAAAYFGMRWLGGSKTPVTDKYVDEYKEGKYILRGSADALGERRLPTSMFPAARSPTLPATNVTGGVVTGQPMYAPSPDGMPPPDTSGDL